MEWQQKYLDTFRHVTILDNNFKHIMSWPIVWYFIKHITGHILTMALLSRYILEPSDSDD